MMPRFLSEHRLRSSSEPGGSITIAAGRTSSGIEISVTDTGLGMSPGRVDDLFRLDRRVTTHGTAGGRGSGLGLLLCRDLVERQDDRLEVRSALGRGTTFSFVLPATDDTRSDARTMFGSLRDREVSPADGDGA